MTDKVTIKKQTALTAQRMVKTDRWINERNHFGGSRDPIARTSFYRDVTMTREMLDAMYRFDWLTRKAVDIPAQDATRKWIRIKGTDEKLVQKVERELERLRVQERIEELIILSRLYGGGLMIVGAWDGRDVTEPLGQVRDVRFLANVDRYLAYPMTFYSDKLDPKFGEVEHYQITRPMVIGTDVAVVHETRVIRLDGNYLPPLERIRNFTFGASIVENILEASRQFGICTQALAGVVQDFVTKKLKVSNLQELLQDAEGREMLMLRVGELAASISMHSIATFGEDEEFDKMGTPITGLPDLSDRFVEYASAATGIPRGRLFNNLSGRLGGDAGENDLRTHYDNIEAFQKNRLRRPVQQLLDIVLAPLGYAPGEAEFEWVPLWQLSETDAADIRLKVAQTDQIYIQTGVVEPEEVALSRFSGDGIDLDDMHIEEEPRKKFLKVFAKSEPRDPAPEPEPTNPENPNGPDPEKKRPNGSAAAH